MKEHLLRKLEIPKEIQLCRKSVTYFIDNYATCMHHSMGNIALVLQEYQESLVTGYVDYNDVIVRAPRQSGLSLVTAMYILWYAIFEPDLTIGLISNKHEASRSNLRMIRHAYNNLPYYLKDVTWTKTNNKNAIQFCNNTRVLSLPNSTNALRGMSFDLIFLDNCEYVKETSEDSIYDSIRSATPSDKSKLIFTSTPGGTSSKFYELFQDATKGLNSFHPIHIGIDDVTI